jgi:hypothetical protein
MSPTDDNEEEELRGTEMREGEMRGAETKCAQGGEGEARW